MYGDFEMLHLQVSHLKIPIHYIVYGKVTPFTDHYATLLCPGVPWYNRWHRMDVFCKGTVLKVKRVQAPGVFFVAENLQHYTASRKYTPPAHWPGLHMVCKAASAVDIINNCLLKNWINYDLYFAYFVWILVCIGMNLNSAGVCIFENF